MENQLPYKIQELSKQPGMLDGYIRFVDRNHLVPILKAGYARSDDAVPFAVTAFGEILTWERDRYICKVSFFKHSSDVLASGVEFFFDDLKNSKYAQKCFDVSLYYKAMEKFGPLDESECFGIVPLPALGGTMNLEYLQKVKYREYLYLAIQTCGMIDA